jgi:GTPase involved in cell partitioning and DNA repair
MLRKAGGGSKCHGADGGDLEVPVPPGTIVRSRDAADGDAPIAELLHPGAPQASITSHALPFLHVDARSDLLTITRN